MGKSYKEIMNDIRVFVLDVDGVLTDGSLHISANGELLRTMNVKDGFAMKVAIEQGYNICVISGGKNEIVKKRLKDLGVSDIYLGAGNKLDVLKDYVEIYGLSYDQMLYMGDDIPDKWVMEQVALPCCPQDAVPEIKGISKYISHKKGGKGAVRDVIEQVLKVQGKWVQNFDNV